MCYGLFVTVLKHANFYIFLLKNIKNMFINNMHCVCKCMFSAVGSLTAFNCFKQRVAYNLGSNSFKV